MGKTKSNIPKSKRGGYDLWSRRSLRGCSCLSPGRVGKSITKIRERMRDKEIERKAYIDPDNIEGRFPGE
jgi:hypothetical protein